ncbi:hypothetical protein SDC9_182751 [bioreactor metagenome]|uniref:Uncharacterized protein n=1 Tax=bioreactor metagenome TaxID=1076179 RepID=A0A645HGK3_9ZZZZ
MAKGVSKIEQGALTLLSFIRHDNLGLVRTRSLDRKRQRFRVAYQQGIQIGLEPLKKGQITNQPVLDHFGDARSQLARRQGIEHTGISQHELRLIEGANHVFAQRVIDRRLATHRGVHLRQQRCGNLDERHAALITRCGKPTHIPNHSTTKGDQGRGSLAASSKQCIKNQIQRRPILVRLTIG